MFNIARISPSIIATDYKNEKTLKENLLKLEKANASMLHLDVMDGKFVKNITFDSKMVNFCKNNSSLLLDVHLMIVEPEKHIDEYADAGADILTIHYEATKNIKNVLLQMKKKHVICGVSINPNTPVCVLKPLLDQKLIDLVLIMSVEPGEYGQEFIPGSAEKVAELNELNNDILIEVDGGVNLNNSKMLRKLGADILVSGKTVFESSNIKKTIKALRGSDFGFYRKKLTK